MDKDDILNRGIIYIICPYIDRYSIILITKALSVISRCICTNMPNIARLSVLSLKQTYTAVYYVLADLLMLAMYFYYVAKNKMVNSE